MIRSALIVATLALASPVFAHEAEPCQRELAVLGAGQDAGAPQVGYFDDNGPRLLPSSLGLVDRQEGERYLFDATPAITEQYALLHEIDPSIIGIKGIFLTHAHIGHYLGLAWLGREADNTKGAPVYAMPRMVEFLRKNGPWSQLVELGNIELRELSDKEIQPINGNLGIWTIQVPHRDEYSETVGFIIMTVGKRALYMPDLDSWEELAEYGDIDLLTLMNAVDYAFVDATFWDDNELPDRDMSEIPHPRVTETMDSLQDLPPEERAKVHFIHYNHTNPIRDPASPESAEVEQRGFNVARRGMRFCLD